MATSGAPVPSSDAQRAGDLVRALFGGTLGKGLSDAQRAAREWYAANGDRERAHTTGVWLARSRVAGADPVMVVSVDSGLLAADLGTNKDLYLSRLAMRGVRVSDIRFRVGRHQGGRDDRHKRRRAVAGGAEPHELPSLTPAERARVERACEDLPPNLKESVSRAMCASLRRNKGSHTS